MATTPLAKPDESQFPPGLMAEADGNAPQKQSPQDIYGPNFESLEEMKPDLVAELRQLVLQYKQEGIVARRYEIQRIRQARLFWQGIQYGWWNPVVGDWQMPTSGHGLTFSTDKEDVPRYQYVTNFYQAFGLSFIAAFSGELPTVRFYPQSAQTEEDVTAAKAASDVAELVEHNNKMQAKESAAAYYMWTDGKIAGYVRYVADAARFGTHDQQDMEADFAKMGEDAYVCPQCGTETPANQMQMGMICPSCGTELSDDNFKQADYAQVPNITATRKMPNGQEVISFHGGLEINSPVWADEIYEMPYLQWTLEVHKAKLKATYPKAADKIQPSGAQDGNEVYARSSRLGVKQGLPAPQPGDALQNLITFARTWIRPWALYQIEDKAKRDELLQLFPDGVYVAFAGDAYCEARSEILDDHWRVMNALPGDGQSRPSIGGSTIQVQERYNILSNIAMETYEYGIPPIYADPNVVDFDALSNTVSEPAAMYPARAKPGQPLTNSFYQAEAATFHPEMNKQADELVGPVAQFLTGLFPAIFGGEMQDQKTATGYGIARDQAMGRIGLVWGRWRQFYTDLIMLAVDCFRKNRAEDVEIPIWGEGGDFESKVIHLADLKGNLQAYPEGDEQFPRMKSQLRAAINQLFTMAQDPVVGKMLSDPANIGQIKNIMGLSDFVVPGEDSRTKQLREIQQLLQGAPIEMPPQMGPMGPVASPPQSTVEVDAVLDNHEVEFEECQRWANSDAGQTAKVQNSAGYSNVRAHAEAHQAAMQTLMAAMQPQVPPSKGGVEGGQ